MPNDTTAKFASKLDDLLRDQRASTWYSKEFTDLLEEQLAVHFRAEKSAWCFAQSEKFVYELASFLNETVSTVSLAVQFDMDRASPKMPLASLFTRATKVLADSLAAGLTELAEKARRHIVYSPLKIRLERRAFEVELLVWTYVTPFIHPKYAIPRSKTTLTTGQLPLIARYKRKISRAQ